jgi:hypothetical protein
MLPIGPFSSIISKEVSPSLRLGPGPLNLSNVHHKELVGKGLLKVLKGLLKIFKGLSKRLKKTF